jgi:hypothetical protein
MLAVFGRAVAEPPSDAEKKLMNTLMQKAVLISVMNVAHPEAFLEDNDPNTLQIVFLTDPKAKPHVSDDGEVVFMPDDISIADQGYLTQEAFLRKARRIMAGNVPPP